VVRECWTEVPIDGGLELDQGMTKCIVGRWGWERASGIVLGVDGSSASGPRLMVGGPRVAASGESLGNS